MALTAIERVREAELSARDNVLLVQKQTQEKIALSQKRATEITDKASEKAIAECSAKEDRARKKADEIMVTARNQSLLSCEEIKRNSIKKQDSVNNRILKLMSDI